MFTPSRFTSICNISRLLLLLIALHASAAQQNIEPRIDPQRPLEAELLIPLDVQKLAPAATIIARVRFPWALGSCSVRSGSLVTGHVVQLQQRSHQNPDSSLTLQFDTVDCSGTPTRTPLTLFAIIGVPEPEQSWSMYDRGGLFGSTSARPVMGQGGTYSPPPPPLDLNQDMTQAGHPAVAKLPQVVQSGSVFGLKKITLSRGSGGEGTSVITAAKQNLRLETATQLVFMPVVVPRSIPPPVLATASPTPKPAPPTPPAARPPEPATKPEVDETEVCAADCVTVSSAPSQQPASADIFFSTARLGYVPHENREYTSFNNEATLTYLGAANLLFTFDTHTLRQRIPGGVHPDSAHAVRAVLLDASTLAVRRVLDWQVEGSGAYLWRAGSGRLLVHRGHQLRLLDSNLETLRALPLSSRLVFVACSPEGDRIAVGTLRERYTAADHRRLEDLLGGEPEEDINIRLYDRDLNPLLTAIQSTAAPPPVLTGIGELRIVAVGLDRWRIVEFPWDKPSHTVATTSSSCRPSLSAPLPGLLFLVGCTSSPHQAWYRVLRSDGHPVLSGRGSSQQIGQALTSTTPAEFAIRVAQAIHSRSPGEPFRKTELRGQQFSVYRALDARRLFTVDTRQVSMAEDSFALSPGGDRLAILTGQTISLYAIPH